MLVALSLPTFFLILSQERFTVRHELSTEFDGKVTGELTASNP